MRRVLSALAIVGGLGALAVFDACVSDPVAADAGVESGIGSSDTGTPDSGTPFCQYHKGDPGLLLCADFDDGMLGPLTANPFAQPGPQPTVEVAPLGFSPPNAARLTVAAFAGGLHFAVLNKTFATVKVPAAISIQAQVKMAASCLPAADRGLSILSSGAEMGPFFGVIATGTETYPYSVSGSMIRRMWPAYKTSALSPDTWSSLKVEVTLASDAGSFVITVDGTPSTALSLTPLPASGNIAFSIGPNNVLGVLDGGAGDGFSGACEMLVDNVLVLNTN